MITEIENILTFDVDKESDFEISYQQLYASKIKIVRKPNNGSLKMLDGGIMYTPKKNFIGNDFFSFINETNHHYAAALSINDPTFKPRARLLIQLGDQLIKNESIALIELAKNSFDADASYCNVTMKDIENRKSGYIVIEDNGFGMDMTTVKSAWLEPGSDNKEKLLKRKKVTPKYKRLPIGEKGIGRFGVHKLGTKIEMISRSENKDEVVVRIDWEKFKNFKYLNDAPVEVSERKPEIFKNSTGTRITISNLSKDWTRGMVRDVYRALNGISTPPTYDIEDIINPNLFSKLKNKESDRFEANLHTDKPEWTKDIPSWNEILEYSLFFFSIEIEDDRILSFKYKFKPWDKISDDIKGRTVTHKDDSIKKLLDISDPDFRKYVPLEFDDQKIGRFRFDGCIFIRDQFIYKLFDIQQTSLTEYLDKNGGIRVYRNGIRVYDYGEQENDWLSLDYRRFNNPGVKLSNNLMLASINLSREDSSSLIEKTNREGFIENKAYEIFKKQILYSLKLVEILRLEDKRKIDEKYRNEEKDTEPVLKTIEGLRSLVTQKVKDQKIQKEIVLYVDRIEKNYRFMNDTLIKSASAGLGWSVYVHEIEKIIAEIVKVLKRDKASERLVKLTSHLSELIESYAQILRRTTKSNQNLSKIIDQAIFNVEYRLEAHRIEIERYDLKRTPVNVPVARNLVISTIMNILDNSIYWLDRSRNNNKKILFDVVEIYDGYISLVISDNGNGFTLPTTQMTEPFVSAKPGGMGLGLYIASEVMKNNKGRISFNEDGNYKVIKDYKNGAVVILSFKK